MIAIRNDCKSPPLGVIWQIRRSLRWIEQLDLEGISFIRLLDDLGKPTNKSPAWFKESIMTGNRILGWYNKEDKNTQAFISLHIADIYSGVPAIYWWTTVPTLLITSALAHEIAHHLVAKRGYIFNRAETYRRESYEESTANRYSFKIMNEMKKRWYYRLGAWAIKDLASTHFIIGVREWKAKKYRKAAEHWSIARYLDPDHREAAHWYWRAIEMCENDDGRIETGDGQLQL